MSISVDNVIALKIIGMLVKPFAETEAFKLGIIDKNGNNLKKYSSLKTSAERGAYTYLTRLVFNMKKIINKLPGQESKLKSTAAALFLIKEDYINKPNITSLMEDKYLMLLTKITEKNIILVEEELAIKRFEEDAPANATGAAVSTNEPVIRPDNIKKFQKMNRRKLPIEVKQNV